jgi:hypothetical protein
VGESALTAPATEIAATPTSVVALAAELLRRPAGAGHERALSEVEAVGAFGALGSLGHVCNLASDRAENRQWDRKQPGWAMRPV